MRILAIALLALLAAGCTTPAGTPTTTTGPVPGHAAAALPPAIADSKMVTGGADPVNMDTQLATEPCKNPPSACVRYPFTLNGTASYEATLTWTLPASDFDLYLMQDGKVLDSSAGSAAGSPPATLPGTIGEALHGTLDAGHYELVVDPYSVAQDTYTFKATFTA
jgi:hypothetical protein